VLAACSTAVPGTGRPVGSGPQQAAPVTLVAAGDIACPPDEEVTDVTCGQEATAQIVESLAPDVVLALGDTAYQEASADELKSYDASWGRFLEITRAVAGNHEYLSGSAADYFDYFGERAGDPDEGWYSFDAGSWHVIVLNSECEQVGGCEADSPQGEWLAADLAAHPARCTLAAWHDARFSSGEEHGDSAAVAPFWQQLQDAGAEVVLTAHEHSYERFAAQRDSTRPTDSEGLVQFVVGTGGRELRGFGDPRPNSEVRWNGSFGVLALTLHADGYDWRFVGPPGTPEVDSGSGSCR
jgi:acid phosphatase type 7